MYSAVIAGARCQVVAHETCIETAERVDLVWGMDRIVTTLGLILHREGNLRKNKSIFLWSLAPYSELSRYIFCYSYSLHHLAAYAV